MNSSLPTFLGIGSMRCGSTWLYKVLRCHPDVMVSEMKEVDFFFLHQMLRHDLLWYEQLFRRTAQGEPSPIRGEISPGYFRLKQWHVNRIAKLLPDLRIILILRDPIERAWSQIVYTLGHLYGRDVREAGLFAFLRQLERPRTTLSSDYIRAIKIWSKAFGREALHVAFFHDLCNDPHGFVDGVLRHLGASVPWKIPDELVNQKVWATRSLVKSDREIPEIVQWYLADQLLHSAEQLDRVLQGKVSEWVEEMRTIRGRTRLSWRILRQLNKTLLSLPERVAWTSYHWIQDVKLWLRWRKLLTTCKSESVATQHVPATQKRPVHTIS